MHRNAARYAILSNYERYIIFRLDKFNTLQVSQPILRDSALPFEQAWTGILTDELKINDAIAQTFLKQISPVKDVNPLVLVAALAIRSDPLSKNTVLPATAWLVAEPIDKTVGTSMAFDRGDIGGGSSSYHPGGTLPQSTATHPTIDTPSAPPTSTGRSLRLGLPAGPPDRILCADLHHIDKALLALTRWSLYAAPTDDDRPRISDVPSLVSHLSSDTSSLDEQPPEQPAKLDQHGLPAIATTRETPLVPDILPEEEPKPAHELVSLLGTGAFFHPPLTPAAAAAHTRPETSVRIDSYVASGRLWSVFRGTTANNAPVVVKLANLSTFALEEGGMGAAFWAIENEVRLYSGALRPLQGHCVPRFLGFWKGFCDRDELITALMGGERELNGDNKDADEVEVEQEEGNRPAEANPDPNPDPDSSGPRQVFQMCCMVLSDCGDPLDPDEDIPAES